MNTIRAAFTFGRWRNRRRYQQPGLGARILRACKLWHFGHSWRFAWRQAGKVVEK